jgi:hypothetical protein
MLRTLAGCAQLVPGVVGVNGVEPASTILANESKGVRGWKKVMTNTPFIAAPIVEGMYGEMGKGVKRFLNIFLY